MPSWGKAITSTSAIEAQSRAAASTPSRGDQAADRVHVHVRAEACGAEEDGGLDHRPGPPPHLLDGVGALALMDRPDRPGQCSVVLPELIPDQGLVEVDVGVDEGREQQAAAAVERVVTGKIRADSRDPLAFNRHIDDLTGGEERVSQVHGWLR